MTSQYGHGFLSIFFGGKYDLIQLHRQIIHQNARNFFFTTKITSTCTFGLKSKENNENDMTSAVWAGTVFGPRLWPLSARRHLLVGKYQKIRKIINSIFFFNLQPLTSRILKFGDRELCTLTKA